jgi:hypothetical protein
MVLSRKPHLEPDAKARRTAARPSFSEAQNPRISLIFSAFPRGAFFFIFARTSR